MNNVAIAVFALAIIAYALVSKCAIHRLVTAPMLLMVAGYCVGAGGLHLLSIGIDHELIRVVAELTLILLLFADAARIDVALVCRSHKAPVRTLLIGLPLVILGGTLFGWWIFPELSLVEAALLAALLAPTDAALSQAVLMSAEVPARIRQAINIDSGLNDGLVLPAILILATIALPAAQSDAQPGWLTLVLMQLTIGPLVGVAIGFGSARILDAAIQREWAGTAFQGIAILATALLSYAVAELLHGNGFISAFMGGAAFGIGARKHCQALFSFMETDGRMLMLITFFVVGAGLLPDVLTVAEPVHFLYAFLSLTIVRILPIAISLLGSGLHMSTWLFLGWFGPRGLASILFLMVVAHDHGLDEQSPIFVVTVITVGMSVLLHGITAAPLAGLYSRHIERIGDCAETSPVPEIPVRH